MPLFYAAILLHMPCCPWQTMPFPTPPPSLPERAPAIACDIGTYTAPPVGGDAALLGRPRVVFEWRAGRDQGRLGRLWWPVGELISGRMGYLQRPRRAWGRFWRDRTGRDALGRSQTGPERRWRVRCGPGFSGLLISVDWCSCSAVHSR